MPDFIVQDKTFKVILVLKNDSHFDEEMWLVRQKICDCKQVEIPDGMTRRKKVFDCPHRLMLKMILDQRTLKVQPSKIACFIDTFC